MAKILVVDDEIQIRDMVQRAFKPVGYEVITVPDAEQAVAAVSAGIFDLILLDINLTDASGLSVLKKIREIQDQTPVVIYSGQVTAELEKEARLAGAHEVLSKQVGINQLMDQVRKIVEAKSRIVQNNSLKKQPILVVDDEESIRKLLRHFFERKRYPVLEAEDGEKAIEVVRNERPNLALLDLDLPGLHGLEVLRRFFEIHPNMGVIIVTGRVDESVEQAIKLGAYSYILKPFDLSYLELVVFSKLLIAESV